MNGSDGGADGRAVIQCQQVERPRLAITVDGNHHGRLACGTGLARGQRCGLRLSLLAPRPVRWPSGRVGKRLPGRTRPHGPYRSRGHQARARLPVSAPLSHGESDAYALPWCQWRIRRTTCLRHLESRSDRCLWPRRLRWPGSFSCTPATPRFGRTAEASAANI